VLGRGKKKYKLPIKQDHLKLTVQSQSDTKGVINTITSPNADEN